MTPGAYETWCPETKKYGRLVDEKEISTEMYNLMKDAMMPDRSKRPKGGAMRKIEEEHA